MTLGALEVERMDYAYTLQGWLKGVNSTMLFDTTDIGGDGMEGGPNQYTARDAIGFNLNYYDTSDYTAIGNKDPFPGTMAWLPGGAYRPLFNGNISGMAVHQRALQDEGNTGGPLMFYNYKYDQLNRITGMDAFNKEDYTTNHWSGMTQLNYFRERVAYDGNGNITGYLRNGHKEGEEAMDSLGYQYTSGTDKLNRITDEVPANRYGQSEGDVADIDNQGADNYGYDEIGNLIKDEAEGITDIKWSVYGKILEITRTSSSSNPVQKIAYSYDAQGNRVSKTITKNNGTKTITWYVRDAQGNALATYHSFGATGATPGSLPLKLKEHHLYGSARLGIYRNEQDVDEGPRDMSDSNATSYGRGLKQYELTNHLGNVLATVSDRKRGVDTNEDDEIDYYDPEIVSAQDYYPFGMLMPGRTGYQGEGGWTGETAPAESEDEGLAAEVSIDQRENNQPPEYKATQSVELHPGFTSGIGDEFLAYISEEEPGSGGSGSGSSSLNGYYRYGFNGKENDNEIKGTGNCDAATHRFLLREDSLFVHT